MKALHTFSHFEQLIALLEIFQLLASSNEVINLNARPIANAAVLKEQQRLQKIYHYIETNYRKPVNVNDVAKICHLTTAAFCRYLKKQRI